MAGQYLLHEGGADFTQSFRSVSMAARGDEQTLRHLLDGVAGLDAWVARWAEVRRTDADVADEMDRVNPVYIPRNHLVDDALNAATSGDLEPFGVLVDVLAQPFVERSGLERFAEPAPADFTRGFRTY